jgi:DNA primase
MASQSGLTAPKPKSGVHENRKKDDGMKQSQKLLLTWLTQDTGLFSVVEPYISPADFTEELYRKVADILFEQYHETGTVNPAQIISLFEDEEEHRRIAALFNTHIRDIETPSDKEKALKETIVRIKKNSIRQQSARLSPTDMAGLQKLVADKRQLEQLERVHISTV